MDNETLKPCPFCGGNAEYHSDNGPTGEVYGWVGCNQCDAMSVHCDIRSMQPEDTHPIDAWNTRAPVEAEREAAAKAALEAAARIVAPTMNKRGPFAMTVSSAILAIDPAQFRSDRDGQ